jgi:UDP-2,3-diacylglucosamine pyrophosphatase LpxH
VKTAIISDLHLGSASRRDLVRNPAILDTLLESVAGADRVVLLGDTFELFEGRFDEVIQRARLLFEGLAETLDAGEVVLVPGNHDHRFAEPLLRSLESERRPLALEHRIEGPSGTSDLSEASRWLGRVGLQISYPGIWLRDGVYATHGHYMDCYRRLPRLECIAAATMVRAVGPLPDRTTPDDYERVLCRIYRAAFRLAQVGVARRIMNPSEKAWRTLAGGKSRPWTHRTASRIAPSALGALNRALRHDFTTDFSYEEVSVSGAAAATELFRHLKVEADHVLVGHTHRAGPVDGESAWVLPGGARLHNTGSWVSNSAFGDPPPRPFRPGDVTWLDETGSPYRLNAFEDAGLASPATT